MFNTIDVRKNWKIKTSEYHTLDLDQVPTKIFCWKADYAEATGSHNTSTANYAHILYGDAKTPPQEADSRVRTTVYGRPSVIFHKADSSSDPVFYGKANANIDKGALECFGFTEDYSDAQCVEFCNNVSEACLFHKEISDDWSDDFEFRQPDGYTDISDFKIVHDWTVSTWQDGATGTALNGSYTGIDGTVYTNDTAAYRLAKFKKEFTDYYNLDFCLVYYVLTFVLMCVDQRAKNMFLTTWDKVHWEPWFYDNDTILGINNEGRLVFSPFLEDDDQLDGANVFNGATSALWVNFRESFPNEIQALYASWRSEGLLSYDQIIEYFITRQTDKWSISVYSEDIDFKYVSLLRDDDDGTYLYQVRGTGEEHLRYFTKARLNYLDSKWCCGDYPSDYVSLRIYTPMDENNNPLTNLPVAANPDITITPYENTYAGVQFGAGSNINQYKAYQNVPITLKWTMNGSPNDLETSVFPASQISSLGDLSPLYCGTINVSKAEKLTELIVGNQTKGYSNNNLTELAVGANNLLQKVDICNCPNLVKPLALSNCPNIQEIYAIGSGITGLELPTSGYLKKVYLPNTLTNLTVTNQQYIEEFVLEGYDNLTTLRIEDTVNIPVEDIMLNAPNLNRIRLIDVQWEAESEAALVQTIEKFKSCLGLDANGNNTENAIVTGKVHVAEKVSNEVFGDVYNSFPDLVIDDGSEEIYILNYKDRDGKILYSTRVAEGANAIDPIAQGYIETPDPIITDTYRYEFVAWSTLPTNIQRHYVIIAQYHTKFAIKFYNEETLYYTQWSVQGDPAIDPVVSGAITAPTKSGTSDISYKFSGWDNLPTNVQSTVNVYAQYDTYWAVRFWNDSVLYLTEWIIEGGKPVNPSTYSEDYTNPTRTSTAQYDYHFSSWDGDFDTEVTSTREFYAVYSSTIRRYNVYFYNDNELLYTVENVQYGSSASYSGSTPTKLGVEDPDEYVFKGWLPAPENITGETKCYALYKFTGYLFGKLGKTDDDDQGYGTVDSPNWDAINAYWTTIAADVSSYQNGILAEDDFTAKYQIGGRMIVPINLSDGTSTMADVEIIAHNHDNLADGSGKAALTFFCKDLPQVQRAMNESTVLTGYKDSIMRTFVNEELFGVLPNELTLVIKPVKKISDGGAQNQTLVTTTDYCWIASYDEVGFTSGGSNISGQGELYDEIFSNNNSRKKYITDSTDTGGWWLRTSVRSTNLSSTMFYRVQKSGAAYTDIQTNQFYVAFGFCI